MVDNVFGNECGMLNNNADTSCSSNSFVLNPFLDRHLSDLIRLDADLSVLQSHFDAWL
jgi:hypothetical protein